MVDHLMRFVVSAVILCSQYTAAGLGGRPSVAHLSAIAISTAAPDEPQAEARRIWKEAIVAKGGRERLYSVRNVLISGHQGYVTHKGKENQVHREVLYVLPNKYWFYDDYGSDVFGIRMHMYNFDTAQQYFGAPGNPETRLEPIDKSTQRTKLDSGQVALLLETKWLRPVPLKATTERIGLTKVDVVQTDINGARVDFAFEQRSHLPIQVRFYDAVNNKTYIDVRRFSDYTEVNGIKVPQTVKLSDGTADKSVIQFNVKYDEDIFTKPPTKADPEVWRPKNKE